MISVEEALQIILKSIPVLGLEKVDILNALGRVLGEDLYAPYHIPHWDNSAMDGYAVIQNDIKDATPEELEQLFESESEGKARKTLLALLEQK